MKIWCISDTHTLHGYLKVPDNIDMVIHAGDESNLKVPSLNYHEFMNFWYWWESLDIKYKVFVPGNHSTAIYNGLIPKEITDKMLIHQECEIQGIKIFGSPYTPTFGTDWAYNAKRNKLQTYWDIIPNNIDILVTHGPPKYILDLTEDNINMVQVGCKSLMNKVINVQPKYHIFGHIHTEKENFNSGTYKSPNYGTTFINASVVNLRANEVINNGIIIEI